MPVQCPDIIRESAEAVRMKVPETHSGAGLGAIDLGLRVSLRFRCNEIGHVVGIGLGYVTLVEIGRGTVWCIGKAIGHWLSAKVHRVECAVRQIDIVLQDADKFPEQEIAVRAIDIDHCAFSDDR